ncbi:MAG: hypothetical protein WBF05_07160 [Anaerolineales bacterium]
MANWLYGDRYRLHILESFDQMKAIEDLQREVWPGDETGIVPSHLLLTIVHNGGLIIGAYQISESKFGTPENNNFIKEEIPPDAPLIGFIYGFPGIYSTPDGPRLKHCSHQMGVHPNHRDQGIGFVLKRAQWQMVRHQGIDRITWTYDPLQSRNAYLNIAKLGAVCNTYLRDIYGSLEDDLNVGLPSDRFQVDWWTNTQRAKQRLNKKARLKLDLAHFLAAGAEIVNPTFEREDGLPRANFDRIDEMTEKHIDVNGEPSIILIEIPADFLDLKAKDFALAQEWRFFSRTLFEFYFGHGYLATDFVRLVGDKARSFYVLIYGERTL